MVNSIRGTVNTNDHHAGYYYNLTGHVPDQSFLTLGNPWPMAVCLVLFALAFWIPQTITGRSDSAGEF